MEKLRDYLAKVPQEFWFYNAIVGLIWYILSVQDFFFLLVFPFAVLMVRYLCLNYFENISVEYVGFYPFKQDIKWALIAFLVSFPIYILGTVIIILGALYIFSKERQAS
ncbi:hypothetical protein HZY88_04895 [Aerococcaceae bacterium DSM 111176]|nr:hypothetical protein [Aerococcaceae bacterium DSM 111176]